MKYGIKLLLSAICMWVYNMYEHNVTVYESQLATSQLDNDSSYIASRFFAEGTSSYMWWIVLIIIFIIWYTELHKVYSYTKKQIISKTKEGA